MGGGMMPPGGAPPMDPSMMGGAPPMDPSMMGMAPPMDPTMAGGAPPAEEPPPAEPAGGGELASMRESLENMNKRIDDLVNIVKTVISNKGNGNGTDAQAQTQAPPMY